MPDEEGRTKLTKLYAGGLDVSEQLLGEIVSRTKGATPAFIKELMRRCAQFQIEFSPGNGPSPLWMGQSKRCYLRAAP